MIHRFVALSLLAIAALAQGTYVVERKSSLSTSAETITVQLPAGTVRTAKLVDASIYCSAQCEVTLERDGSLATTTTVTPVKLNSTDSTATAQAYRSSNAGSGTTIGRQIIGAGQVLVFDVEDVGLTAGETFTVRTDAITATVIVSVKWREF